MPRRPLPVRVGWTLRDYAKRVWDNAGEDNIFFLTGGVTFNILLAIVPFVLLILSGLGYLLNQNAAESSRELWSFIDGLLPPHAETADAPVHKMLDEIINARGSVGILGIVGFIWFSTRLFGSLRTVLAEVFDIEDKRGIVGGKIFDIKMTVVATLLFAGYTVLNTYVGIATSRGVRAARELGVHAEVMGRAEYYLARLTAAAFILLMFFALYKFLPDRRIRWQSAMLAAAFTSLFFELARDGFTAYLQHFDPGSLYTGTLYTIIIIVFWVYYSALFFILGGEVGQVYELRRVKRLQRITFEE
jgi:membrane protein